MSSVLKIERGLRGKILRNEMRFVLQDVVRTRRKEPLGNIFDSSVKLEFVYKHYNEIIKVLFIVDFTLSKFSVC